MTRDQFVSLFFLGLLVFVIYQLCLIFSPFLKPIFWSAILAFGFFPLYQLLKVKLNGHSVPAALLMTLFIFLVVIPPVAVLVISITEQTIELYQLVVNYIRQGHLEKLIEDIRSLGFVQRIEAQVVQWDVLKDAASNWLLNTTKAVGNFAASQAGTITKNLALVFFNVLVILVLLFVFLKDGDKIYQFIYNIAPLAEKTKKMVFGQMNDTFSAVIRGQILTSITQAIVAGLIFWFLGLPVPVIFATATFLGSLIPVVGASAVWVPLVIYLVIIQSYIKAVILLIFGILVISLIDNIMKPAIIGEKTKLPYFLLFFGILGGLKVYGLMGIFLAPVVLSVFFALVKIYQEEFV